MPYDRFGDIFTPAKPSCGNAGEDHGPDLIGGERGTHDRRFNYAGTYRIASNAAAAARPIPVDAPVIKATLFCNFVIGLYLFLR